MDGLLRNIKPHVSRILRESRALPTDLWQRRYLLLQLTRLFVQRRYKGSFLGMLWSVLTPLCLLAVYTVAFSYILGVRWSAGRPGHMGFALVLFCGLVGFDLFSQSVTQASSLMASHPSFVKKAIFPTQLLPVALVLSGLTDSLIKLLVLCATILLVQGGLPSTALLLPLAYVPLILLTLGCSFFLSVWGSFFRDIGHAVSLLAQMLFFLTPIFYPPEIVPAWLRPVLLLNPLAHVVEYFRQALLFGQSIPWGSWLVLTGLCLWVCMAGYSFFMDNRMELADLV
ncbi:MAG: ABC transporter permease [Thermodesulfobacteriota bacterium]